MIGQKRRLVKIVLLFLIYLFWTYLPHSADDKTESEKELNKPREIVHANEMRIVMWKTGLQTFQDWMSHPPVARVTNSNSRYFDLSSCDLGLEDGLYSLTNKDLRKCDKFENVIVANITVLDTSVTGLASLKLPDGRICELVYQGGVLHGMQRIFNKCVQTKHRGEMCLQLVG